MAPSDSQLKRGESDADTARVLSGMVDLIVTRTISHSTAETYARNSSVPVVNGLSDSYHPCQLLADLQTLQEVKGSIRDTVVAWIGRWQQYVCFVGNRGIVIGIFIADFNSFTIRPKPDSDAGFQY